VSSRQQQQVQAEGATTLHYALPRAARRLRFCLRFNSPGGQAWQKRQLAPILQPCVVWKCAQGLHAPTVCALACSVCASKLSCRRNPASGFINSHTATSLDITVGMHATIHPPLVIWRGCMNSTGGSWCCLVVSATVDTRVSPTSAMKLPGHDCKLRSSKNSSNEKGLAKSV
jgi:hypothetical protein